MTRLLATLPVLLALTIPIRAQDRAQLTIGASYIDVVFGETPRPALRALVLDWISTSADSIVTYHERFPVARVEIRVRLGDGHGPSSGTTYGWNGALITIAVGRASTAADFVDDWLMPHEMLHLGFPSVPDRHHWFEEASRLTWNRSRAPVQESSPRRKLGAISCAACRKASRRTAIVDSI